MAIEFSESTFCKHSHDFTLNFKRDPKLEGVAAAKASLCEGKTLSETWDFFVQLLVLYFRFSRATSGALSRALLSVFSCNFWCPFSCSTFGFLVQLLVPFLVLYFRFSRATSGALLSFFSCNFWCPFSCSTFGFLVQLLVPFLVLYFRFSRATSGALLSFFSCNFWCSFSCYFFCSSFFFMCYLALPLLIT